MIEVAGCDLTALRPRWRALKGQDAKDTGKTEGRELRSRPSSPRLRLPLPRPRIPSTWLPQRSVQQTTSAKTGTLELRGFVVEIAAA